MALWFDLRIGGERIGTVEIRRLRALDLTDKTAIADEVCAYRVSVDGATVGEVEHRYGDGAYRLTALAAGLIAEAGR